MKMARPTTENVAERNWREIPAKMKAKVPTLVEQAMKRIEAILNDDKAADSTVLRAADTTLKLYKEMKESEATTLAADEKEDAEAEGLAAALALPKSNAPSISLVAFTPPEQKQG